MRERGEVVRARLDRDRLEVGVGLGGVRLDHADVVEEELVAAGRAEHALLEEIADLRRRALVVVGVDLDDEGDLVLDELAEQGAGDKIKMQVEELNDTVLKLNFSEDNISSSVTFHPAEK